MKCLKFAGVYSKEPVCVPSLIRGEPRVWSCFFDLGQNKFTRKQSMIGSNQGIPG